MITDVSAAACKHLTEKLMRGGSTPQKLELREKIESNARFWKIVFPLKIFLFQQY